MNAYVNTFEYMHLVLVMYRHTDQARLLGLALQLLQRALLFELAVQLFAEETIRVQRLVRVRYTIHAERKPPNLDDLTYKTSQPQWVLFWHHHQLCVKEFDELLVDEPLREWER